MSSIRTAHIFCRVIDNFGDIGVCWRLARQLQGEHSIAVTLWVDDLSSFHRICPQLDTEEKRQIVAGVTVRQWTEHGCDWEKENVPDLVIEAFACDLPQAYIGAMAQCSSKPAWINLEYLSAESWVEGCHAMPSPHPLLPLTKYFFFPGFSAATGGLLAERGFLPQRDQFQNDPKARPGFLAEIGATPQEESSLISLFCYPTAPVLALFDALAQCRAPSACLVPEGVATEQVSQFLQKPARAGAKASQGSLTVTVIPFLPQHDYDKLLWSCDLNFVRGEDSLVRALWAGRPFIWNIYPQQQDAHRPKLDAFLRCYADGLRVEAERALTSFSHGWNAGDGRQIGWSQLEVMLPELKARTQQWAERLRGHGDLATKLLRFAEKIG